MKLRKKALLPAIAMVLASVIALSGVTYAWFTTGTTANVTGMDVNVMTANGIQISLDGSDWKSTLTTTDIRLAMTDEASPYATGRKIQYPTGEIAPVSSDCVPGANGYMNMFLGEYRDDGTLKSVKQTEANGTTGNYVAFDLFFKYSGGKALSLNIGESMSEVLCYDVKTQQIIGDDEGEKSKGTETAVRVAFVPLGSSDTEAGARALTGTEEGYTMTPTVWEPNSTTRAPGSTGEKNATLTYYGFKKEFGYDINGNEQLDEGEEGVAESALKSDSEYASKVSTINETVELTTPSNTYTKMRVYIWLEGQDVDCINNISSGDFIVNLQFAVPEEVPATTEGN